MTTEYPTGGFDSNEKSEEIVEENGTIRSPRQPFETALAASEFWTLAAMEEAKPYPLPEVSPATLKEIASEALNEFFSTLKSVALYEPGIVRGTLPDEGEVEEQETVLATQGGYSYPPPYTRFEVPEALYSVYPWITVGKVFFKQDGKAYVGSASSIGNYAIWTAGHIVHAGNGKQDGWSTDMIFVPAYRKGVAPYGRWSVSYMRTRSLWYRRGNPGGLTEDMGGAILRPLEDKKISQRVGALGFAWNRGRIHHWNALGYPALSPFDGETMHNCQASYAYDGTVAGIPPVGIGCDMTAGCSGGPWIWKLLSESALNGNNSYRQKDRPEEMNSPYFDDRAKSLWDLLQSDQP